VGTLSYVVRRLLLAAVTLIGITLVSFSVMHLAPGNPADMQADQVMDPRQAERVRTALIERYHLDEPIPVQYGLWVKDLVTGDLGRSMSTSGTPVVELVGPAFWPTLSVSLLGLLIAFALAVPIGIYSAWKHDGPFDRIVGFILYALHSVPSYVGAIVLILFVSIRWDLLPFRGMRSDTYQSLSGGEKTADLLRHMVLYVTCTTYVSLAYYSRFVRQNLLEVIRQDYIRTARAKGLPGHVVVLRHAFRNTLIPFVTLLGLVFPSLISGSVILEVIFNWPGLGRLLYDSILQRDYPVVMALTSASALLVLIGTLIVDMLYGVIDPRVSHD
jgi:peptide/nickel transport system permease protein